MQVHPGIADVFDTLFDAHAHLRERPSRGAGWIVPGANAERDAAAPRGPKIWSAVGLHPWFLGANPAAVDAQLRALRERVGDAVAIGETGLDAMRRAGPRELQEQAFRAQVVLAMERKLPLILHVVRRHGACLAVLRELGFPAALGGMVHDFGGPKEVVAEWVAAGFSLSLSPRAMARGKEEVARAVPAERLLIETDDAGWEQLALVARWAAEVRGEPVELLAERTAANARGLFHLG